MKTAKEFWRERELEKGSSEEEVDNIIDDMVEVFQFAEEYAQQNTLNRDKVMEIIDFNTAENFKRYFNATAPQYFFKEAADAICSLSLPALGDGEKMEDFYRNKSRTKAYFPPPTKPPPKN